MHRAMLEAVALTMYNHVTAMCQELDISLESIIVSGGGSSGDLFMQIFADVFGLSAIRNEVNGAASLGSAICAAVATGAYDRFETAISKMVRIRDKYEPISKHTTTYRQMNKAVYQHITNYTDAILEKAYPIFNPKDAPLG
jgi:sugar (pentulose or hexulose) kinase